MGFADTIFAQATADGGALAIIRISGKQTLNILKILTGRDNFNPRQFYLCPITCPIHHDILDNAMVVFFQSPQSLTGEDGGEIHLHGSRAIIKRIFQALAIIPETRMAERGEFLQRAFNNGKMDLTQAEAINDLIHAQSENQRKQALRNASGGLYAVIDKLNHEFADANSYAEALIDFADDDLPDSVWQDYQTKLKNLQIHCEKLLNDKRGIHLANGLRVAVIGAPNVGKSSLFNYLIGRDAAIVSPHAGTTRDRLELQFDCHGYFITLYDTAGMRETTNPIEAEGIKRAEATAQEADIRIFLSDNSANFINYPDEFCADTDLWVINKCDLPINNAPKHAIKISVRENIGLNEFIGKLAQSCEMLAGLSDSPQLTHDRQRQALALAYQHLLNAQATNQLEICAEELREARHHLGKISGFIGVEQLLDRIFRDFCIGK